MHVTIDNVGAEWLAEQVEQLTDHIDRESPSAYNERVRYLPESVTPLPGYMRYALTPYWREVVDCFDLYSPVREVNIMKGVQVAYTTAVLESILLYYMGRIKTLPLMFTSADKELATERVENNILPMLQHSGLAGIIRSSDDGNGRKTGKTAQHLQFEGGGYLLPFGAINAKKMRSFSICVNLKDELDGWPQYVGNDGDPDALTDDRCAAYWQRRKICRGSTPLIKHLSKIEAAFLRGDQRRYNVLCKKCNFPQVLRWSNINKENGIIGGFHWELDNGTLVPESVRYACVECGQEHYESDKLKLFSPEEGAKWVPTAKPIEPNIRSYHLPAFYSPAGMQPWYKCVSAYLQGWDPERKRVRDMGKFQIFYNNVLAETFEIKGDKVEFIQLSGHRRHVYNLGEIPNDYARKHCGSKIQLLTCQVDVHKSNLAVVVMGWTEGMRCFLIDYWRFEPEEKEDRDCTDASCSVWARLDRLIMDSVYTADTEERYKLTITLVDAGFENALVTSFCAQYATGVYAILGRDRPSKSQRIKEFAEFKTQAGGRGYTITVDHYKDRNGPILRRTWQEDQGLQSEYHFNAPVNVTDTQLQEFAAETRVEEKDSKGNVSYVWKRRGNARNELWDLLCYGHAAVEIIAAAVCVGQFKLDTVDWGRFWTYVEQEGLFLVKE